MSELNNCSSLDQAKKCTKESYSRETVIRLFSSLCELSDLKEKASHSKNLSLPSIISPSLLVSANNYNTDISNRFSFFCANPTESKAFYDATALQQWQKNINTTPKPPISEIPFCSGWLGYFAYPTSLTTNTKTSGVKAGDAKPIAEFNYYPWAICFDHKELTLNLLGTPSEAAYAIFKLLQSPDQLTQLKTEQAHKNLSSLFSTEGFSPQWSKDDYTKAFDKIQHYLRAGDCYQINLTQPYTAQYQGQASSLLTPLLTQMQPNFGGYFKGAGNKGIGGSASGVELISLSPERFISIDNNGRLEAKPIKGTIKRDSKGDNDQQLINELTNSSKNQAENLMIVDLLRNDLSISAVPGSVKVDKLFELESHPNVHHLVSTISAQLKTDTTAAMAISQAFPGGSITGAPKIRAMEIIEELEAEPRSLYCGSLGYFSDSGHCDFNILIRNLEFRDNTIKCWGGGGITIDSEVDDEYEESITKIKRIMDVVESAGKSSN
jgi:para-aminobenzoate synthetase component 1